MSQTLPLGPTAQPSPNRVVTWGHALLATVVTTPGGLNKAVDRIRGCVGPQIGTRNSFSKLYRVTDPTKISLTDQWRAWLLLTAVGETPAEWDISETVVPAIHRDRTGTLERLLYTPRDLNPEPTGYGSARVVALRPANRNDHDRRPPKRAA